MLDVALIGILGSSFLVTLVVHSNYKSTGFSKMICCEHCHIVLISIQEGFLPVTLYHVVYITECY